MFENMLMAAWPAIFVAGMGFFFYDISNETEEETDRVTISSTIVKDPKQLYQIFEKAVREKNGERALLSCQLLIAIKAPWAFRSKALLYCARYYCDLGKVGHALPHLNQVAEQEECKKEQKEAQRLIVNLRGQSMHQH